MNNLNINFIAYKDKYTGKDIENRFKILANGECIGEIEKTQNRYTNMYNWEIYYDRDLMGCCGRKFPTIIEAKREIAKDYKEHKRDSVKSKKYQIKELPSGDNSDFFPTPSYLAGKMLASVKWKKLKTVLEPSAGKGNIVECVQAYGKAYVKYRDEYYSRSLNLDIDCIEIDANLRYILMGKNFRVVHDDFLTYNTQKRYDLIIMNPPFSNGDEHLLKALEMQENSGGQIVCLLNAETLRNPYTNRHKLLLQKLNKHGAQIEYVKNAFKRAERKTDTVIALVYIHIPPTTINPKFSSEWKKRQNSIWTSKQKITNLRRMIK